MKQYQALFRMDDVELEFTEKALGSVADEALKLQTGARGLRAILEQTLLDVMYEIPSLKDVTRCTVDEDSILKRRRCRSSSLTRENRRDAELFQVPIAGASESRPSSWPAYRFRPLLFPTSGMSSSARSRVLGCPKLRAIPRSASAASIFPILA